MVHIVSEMLVNSERVRNVATKKNRIRLEDALTTMPQNWQCLFTGLD